MADWYNINLIQGDSLALRVIAKDINDNIMDLTNYSVSGHIRNRYSDSDYLLAFNSTVSDPTGGVVNMTLSSTGTAILPVGQLVYDLEATNTTTSNKCKFMQGYINVFPEVTK